VTHSCHLLEGRAPVSAAGKFGYLNSTGSTMMSYLRSVSDVSILPRFSEIEAVTFLANLILKYKFAASQTDEVETPEETKERLLRWRQGALTLHPVKVPLTFMIRGD